MGSGTCGRNWFFETLASIGDGAFLAFGNHWATLPITAKPITLANQPTGATTAAAVLQTLNVRNGPGIQYTVLSQLATGATVQVIGRTPIGGELWWQIVYPLASDGRAWINGDAALVQVTQWAQVPVIATQP